MRTTPPPLPASLRAVPPELLDKAAATVCRLPEGVDRKARNRAILEVLIDAGEPQVIETCLAIDARLDALCALSSSPLLAAWVRSADSQVGPELLAAASEAPLRRTMRGYAFDEEPFFALVLDAAIARGAA